MFFTLGCMSINEMVTLALVMLEGDKILNNIIRNLHSKETKSAYKSLPEDGKYTYIYL